MDRQSQKILIVDDEEVAVAFYSTVFKYYNIDNFQICQESLKVMPLLSP